jgi:FixJ family two-component response regulator
VSEHINATQKGWFAAMKKMHSLQRYKADRLCPIVAVTAFTNQNVIVQAAKCGISEVINKPVSQERLIEILVKYTNIM